MRSSAQTPPSGLAQAGARESRHGNARRRPAVAAVEQDDRVIAGDIEDIVDPECEIGRLRNARGIVDRQIEHHRAEAGAGRADGRRAGIPPRKAAEPVAYDRGLDCDGARTRFVFGEARRVLPAR